MGKIKKTFLTFVAAIVATAMQAQSANGYYVGKNFVSYNDSLMTAADVPTFQILAHGFAKDKAHVYKSGRILEFVDPTTFTIKDDASANSTKTESKTINSKQELTTSTSTETDDEPTFLDRILGTDESVNKYVVSGSTVSYNGKEIKKADAQSFKYVGGEYAADKHHAYYKGRILGEAWGVGQFTYKGNGYASDGVHWYCNGKPVDRD